ncbi:hypothetical protein OAQ84_01165 [Bdellovibrionales bacterium]|nr:hypothetical protein [Bdellovibrionales bacterium]
MAAKIRLRTIKESKGLATIEALPLLVIFLVLITYGLGLFGVIHTSILASISARAYAFETFKHRTNLDLFRDTHPSPASNRSFGIRLHAVTAFQPGESPDWLPVKRAIVFGRAPAWAPTGPSTSITDHNERIYQLNSGRNREVSTSPAWVMVRYGICLNAACGDD